ncbi:MAG: hypothetical protein JO168_02390 [Solirubrobacterales bacterium]|nr:hypothetical protein [Solirubrobacterales bacterium]MBV9585854.1 hypothetical protein [Alphaproteobacteria bacterium]
MADADPTLALIAARFDRFHVEKRRGAYTLLDRRSGDCVARLRAIPNSDRFELLYWSALQAKWRTFGNFGRLRLTLDSAHEIVETETIFRIPRGH